jgi:hypothetical protein
MDRRFALEDTTLSVLRVGFCVSLHDIDVLDEETVLFGVDFENLADFAFILAGDNLHLVIFFDMY